jgi:hypothetical protein
VANVSTVSRSNTWGQVSQTCPLLVPAQFTAYPLVTMRCSPYTLSTIISNASRTSIPINLPAVSKSAYMPGTTVTVWTAFSPGMPCQRYGNSHPESYSLFISVEINNLAVGNGQRQLFVRILFHLKQL